MKRLRNKKGIGVTEFVIGVSIIFGFAGWKVSEGYGQKAVYDCVGTHTNDNCAHEPLDTRWFKR